MTFSFFLSIYSRCGVPASWAARHTTVCLDIDHSDFFTFSPITHTRGHTFKLFKYFSRTDARKYFFTRRVVEPWNNLPQEVACAASVDDFKKLIDQYSSNTMYKCM